METKFVLDSKTIQALLGTAVALVLPQVLEHFHVVDKTPFVALANDLVVLAGLGLAAVFRAQATQPLHVVK